MSKKIYREIHIYLSLFFLPVMLIYVISGVAYVCGYNQDSGMKKEIFKLDNGYKKGDEKEFILNFLKDKNLKIPNNTNVKFNKRENSYIMGSTHYSVSLNDNEIIIKTRSILGDIIMLHKNKTGWYFKILTFGFSITLLLLYISGIIISLNSKNRSKQLLTMLFGFIITFIICYLSV